MFDSKIVTKYVIIHIVQLALIYCVLIVVGQLIDTPTWMNIAILAIWSIKDIVLFPKVWRAYATFEDDMPTRKLIGADATVTDVLDPVGLVRVRGELWKAKISDPRYPATRGDRTKVVGIEGMTLIVEGHSDSRASR